MKTNIEIVLATWGIPDRDHNILTRDAAIDIARQSVGLETIINQKTWIITGYVVDEKNKRILAKMERKENDHIQ